MPKHSPYDTMVLVKHRPGHKRKRTIRMVFIALVCASIAYYIGIYEMRWRHDAALEGLESLTTQYKSATNEIAGLKQQVENLQQSEVINDRAKQEIQDTIQQLREKVAQLQKDVTFYQNIMAPSKNNKGLQIQSVELSARDANKRYPYKIVLAQVANNRRYLEGVVAVNLVGRQEGESIVLPLRDVSPVQELGMKFRFRYFQEFKGEILLPEGFTPEQLQVVAQSKGKNASRIELNSEWSELVPGAAAVASAER